MEGVGELGRVWGRGGGQNMLNVKIVKIEIYWNKYVRGWVEMLGVVDVFDADKK